MPGKLPIYEDYVREKVGRNTSLRKIRRFGLRKMGPLDLPPKMPISFLGLIRLNSSSEASSLRPRRFMYSAECPVPPRLLVKVQSSISLRTRSGRESYMPGDHVVYGDAQDMGLVDC